MEIKIEILPTGLVQSCEPIFWGVCLIKDYPEIPDHEIRKLHLKVMAVAVRGTGRNDYAIYIAPVPGVNAKEEWQDVHNKGQKVSGRDTALVAALFPTWAQKLKYRL